MLYLLKVAVERNWNYMDQDILNHVYQKKIKYLNQFELHTLLANLNLSGEINWD